MTSARPAEAEAPLHAVEVPARTALPSRHLMAMFESQVAGLPWRTRQLLVLAALDDTSELRVLQAAAGDAQVVDDLEPAENARLVMVDDGAQRFTFRHPLARSAVLERSTSRERRRAHLALASQLADRPLLQARHLAEATIGPDEEVAALLEQAAHAVVVSGDPVGAVTTLLRAAEVGQAGAPRSRRLAAAAHIGATLAGQIGEAPGLLEDARKADLDRSASLFSAATSAYLLVNGDGDVDTAHRAVVGALDRYGTQEGGLDEPMDAALGALRYLAQLGARAELWAPLRQALTRATGGSQPDLASLGQIAADPAQSTPADLDKLDRLIDGLSEETDAGRVLSVCGTAGLVDRLAGCREAMWQVLRQSQRSQAVGQSIVALGALCHDRFWSGDWDRAKELADVAIRLGESHDNRLHAWLFHYHHALIAAARGVGPVVGASLSEIVLWAMPRSVGVADIVVHHVGALAALGCGDYDNAYRHTTAINPPGVLRSHSPHALWTTMDLVESAVRTGRRAEARAHVETMRDTNIAAISPRLALLAGASAAIACEDGSSDRLFSIALEPEDTRQWPFEFARVQLLYGEYLRRHRAAIDSRAVLSSALGTFERLGASPWAERASNELRATGLNRSRREHTVATSLTPQEREIATLASAGLTNKQIAGRLFMSPRTVGAHLYRIFPKLGIASRAALHEALATLPLPEDPLSEPAAIHA
jgi:DNA-binding CsgD family transcriptional regulator